MIPTNHRLDCRIQKHPLENPRILEKMSFQLMAWNRDENPVRENESNHIQKDCQDNENLT